MNKSGKIIVVGGNAAGPAAAAKAKRTNPYAKVILFESGDFISTGTCEIPYVLSGNIPDYNSLITYTPEKFKKEKNVDVYTGCEVIGINRSAKSILVYNRKTHKEFTEYYESLILATGSVPNIIPGFPEFAINLFTLKNIPDLIKIKDFIKSGDIESVVIIGSGYIGLEAADAFHNLRKEIIIIEKEQLPLPYTEPEIQLMILELLKKNDLFFIGGCKKIKPSVEDGIIKSLNVDGRILKSDLIISATGFSPNNILARGAGLDLSVKGGIKVDRKLRTSDFHIWACGDCIEIINEVTKQLDYFPLASIAHDQAHIAGENAAGRNETAGTVVKNISVKILNKYQVSVGITSKEAKEKGIPFMSVDATGANLVKVMPQSEQVFGKIVYHAKNKNILGAGFLGGKEISGYGDLISSLIRSKMPAKFLGEINYNYTPPLSPFINLLSILGRKIK
ncbi:MAG TPA: FAD-dependent oxidoreductase [Ignavibacteriaceae bacterium]|nr:FAD-dependent oxidoreductase [Ignavibacteriaceae bacterium]